MSIAGIIFMISIIVCMVCAFITMVAGLYNNASAVITSTIITFIAAVGAVISGAYLLVNLVDASTIFFLAGI